MTSSQLKQKTIETAPYYFERSIMRFFGDTMRNYGVRSSVIDTMEEQNVFVWELYRKHPVKHGLSSSQYFRRDNFEHVLEKSL